LRLNVRGVPTVPLDLPSTPESKTSNGGRVQILSLVAGQSSTNLIAKICRAYPNSAEAVEK